MKIVVPGGSGQIGTFFARARHAAGDEVVVLSRAPSAAPWRTVAWDARGGGAWEAELDGADVVLNLAGRSVNCRYGAKNQAEIIASRVDSTRAVGAAIAKAKRPPRVWLQASTATIYAHRFDAANDDETGIIDRAESNAPPTWRFSIDVATRWERAAQEFATGATRLVLLRSSLVLSPDRGGIFDVLLGLVRRGLGGRASDGRQFVSWIHDRDFLRALDHVIADGSLCGPLIVAAPEPLPNAEFMRALREAAGVRIGLPATKWMLEIGALFMRTETELLLKSRRVFPSRLLASGFRFEFPHFQDAARDLYARWRANRRASG